MKDVSPDDLPFELYEELYLPGRGCWKHHYSVLCPKQLLHLEPLLKKAGIEIKHSRFTDEEDKIILRNWDNIKDELGYNEQDDARFFVGFGLRSNKEEVIEYVERARELKFNQRMCKGLLHRNVKDVRERFKRLFEPKMMKLRLNQTSYEVCRPGSYLIVKKDGKRREISEGELKQVVKAMKEADYNVKKAVKLLSNSWGVQWTPKSITNIIERMARFSGDPLTKKEWIPFYHMLVRELMAAENITDFELVRIFENQEYDWKTKVPWFSVALHTNVSHTKKTLIIAWELILVELRKLLSELRMNGKPFVVYRLSEYIVNGSGFDEWRREKEAQVGEMNDDQARKVFEIVVNEKNKEVNRLQQLTNDTKHYSSKDRRQLHFFCRFMNGELTWANKGNRLSAEMALSVDVFDSDEDDGPLQDPVRIDSLTEVAEVEGNALEMNDHNVNDHSENSGETKKKKRRLSERERTEGEDLDNKVSSPKKKKKKNKMEESEMIEENRDDTEKNDENREEDEGAERKKWKKKMKKQIEEEGEEKISEIVEHSERKEKERKKKKKKSEEMEDNEEDVEKSEENIITAEVSENKEKKKKKKKKRVSLEE